MSHPVAGSLLAAARQRRVQVTVAWLLPWLLAAGMVARRLSGPVAAGLAGIAALAVLLCIVAWRVRPLHQRWLVQRLDADDPGLEDSSALLLVPIERLAGLQRLQRERIGARLAAAGRNDLREAWPLRPLLASGVTAGLVLATALAWPQRAAPAGVRVPASRPEAAEAGRPILLRDAHVRIAPPAYTRLPSRVLDVLDVRIAEGSRLHWRLRFDRQPAQVALQFHDGRRMPLRREGDAWVTDATLRRSGLYRIAVLAAPAGADRTTTAAQRRPADVLAPDRQYRIDVLADHAPRLQVSRPQQTLTGRGMDQARWQLAFEGRDDHGVSARAGLRIITAKGSGEAVAFDEVNRTLAGIGSARRRSFRHALDVGGFGLAAGDDLIVQFSVADNRPGAPQVTRSASYILRWPPQEATTASAIDGMVKTVLPAYFRSQRQIILDAEALLKEKPRLDAERFAAKSDAIGVDQRLLRLRYGQFLGEETEGAPRRPLMPTNDAEEDAPTEAPATPISGPPADDHDHDAAAAAPAPGGFGADGDVLEQFGHTHDHAEAATLLDAATRRTLKLALDAMWQSELQLRQAMPQAALAPANVALTLIKQVQQADRIYLARVGYEQVPVDPGRRLGGARKGIASRPRDALVDRIAPDAAPAALWRALQRNAPVGPELAAFDAWLARDGRGVRDPLTLAAATGSLRRQPGCMRCRTHLRALLWPLLRPPLPAPQPRAAADAAGRAYLEAIAEPER